MNGINLLSFAAAISSVVLAIVAIGLSIVFFRMSSELSESTKEAAKGIGASVERLEKLFDKLYADTFSMMRDTVSDMRKHIWPEKDADSDKLAGEAEKRADEKVSALKKDMEKELSLILQRQRITDEKVSSLRGDMRGLLERAIVESRQVEVQAREEAVREQILRQITLLRRRSRPVTADAVVSRLMENFPPHVVVRELERMREEGSISLSDETVDADTVIELKR